MLSLTECVWDFQNNTLRDAEASSLAIGCLYYMYFFNQSSDSLLLSMDAVQCWCMQYNVGVLFCLQNILSKRLMYANKLCFSPPSLDIEGHL